MYKSKLLLAAIASLILSLIVLSEVSYMLLDDPAEYLEESYEEREFDESEEDFRKLLRLPSHNGILYSASRLAEVTQVQFKTDHRHSALTVASTPPLFILYCSLKLDLC